MGSYIGNVLVSMPQPRDRLENRRSTDNEISREVWKEIEKEKTDKARMAEVEREREKEKRV